MGILTKLNLARESFDNPLDETAEGYIATGEPESDTASAAILEATKESAEIDEDLGLLDNTMEAADNVDDQVEIGEIAVEQNKYTPMLGMIQRAALKNALSKVASRDAAIVVVDGTKEEAGIMPATESFDTGKGGVLAVEKMKETASELWASVKAQFKAAMERIAQFFRNIFDAGTKLKNRAEKLKAAKLKSTGEKVKKFAGASAIIVGDKLGSDAINGFETVVKAAEEGLNESRLQAGHLAVAADVKGALIDFTGGDVPSDLKSTAPEGATVTCSKEASGGVVLATITGKGEAAEVAKDSHNVVHRTAKKEAPAESDALTDAEIANVLSKAAHVGDIVSKAKGLASKLDAANREFEKSIGKATKGDKDGERLDKEAFTGVVTFARRATAFRKDLTTLALGAANAMCNYAEASARGGKKEEDKKDDKKTEDKKD